MGIEFEVSKQPMAGDRIFWTHQGGTESGIVKLARWEPTAKGGKILIYETEEGAFVNADHVDKVEKIGKRPVEGVLHEVPPEDESVPIEDFMYIVDQLFMPADLKTVVNALLIGDLPNLKVAQHLLNRRIAIIEKGIEPTR